MNCIEIAAIALRILSADANEVRAEPGLFIETGCHIEIGASWRDGSIVADVGVRVPVAGIAWIRPGVEADRRRRFTPAPQPRLGPGESKAQIIGRETLDPVTEVRPRLSVGADLPMGRFTVSPEVELTRGGSVFLSIRHPIGKR